MRRCASQLPTTVFDPTPLAPHTISTPVQSPTSTMNSQTYQGYLDAFNNRNFDKLLTYYAEDVEFTLPNAAPVKGREGIRKFYAQFEGKIAEEVVANDICE